MHYLLKIPYNAKSLIGYLRYVNDTELLNLYHSDVYYALKGACKIPPYRINKTEYCVRALKNYSTLDNLFAYDIFLCLSGLAFKWKKYSIRSVFHVAEDRFILDVDFTCEVVE